MFEVNPAGLNWPRAVMILDVVLVPLVVFWAIGHQEYLLCVLFGVLFAALADPGGGFGSRAWHIAVFGLTGAALTALGFGIGADAWGWLVLAAAAVTLLAGLAIAFGVHRFVAAYLPSIWFIIALVLASGFHHAAHITERDLARARDLAAVIDARLRYRTGALVPTRAGSWPTGTSSTDCGACPRTTPTPACTSRAPTPTQSSSTGRALLRHPAPAGCVGRRPAACKAGGPMTVTVRSARTAAPSLASFAMRILARLESR